MKIYIEVLFIFAINSLELSSNPIMILSRKSVRLTNSRYPAKFKKIDNNYSVLCNLIGLYGLNPSI